MPAFKRLGPEDQSDGVLVLHPRYRLVSGSQGWSGSPEGSASLSLYGGARRRPGVVSTIEYQSLAPNVGQTGNPRRGLPLTASVQFVYMTSGALGLDQRTATHWGEEHWDVVNRLYEDYRVLDPDYVTSSYDHYCLYFRPTSRNVVVCNNGSATVASTGSFVLESWVKPTMTGGVSPMTIQSMNRCLWFGITGSNGALALSGAFSLVTSSLGPVPRRWSHVAVAYDQATQTGSFYVNLRFAGAFVSPSASFLGSAFAYYSVGNRLDNTAAADAVQGFTSITGTLGWSFDGLVGETRVWDRALTVSQVSGTAFVRLTGSQLIGPSSTFQFTEGPLSRVSSYAVGSGTVDVSARAREGLGDRTGAQLRGFDDRFGPVWLPSDNAAFFVPKLTAGRPLDSGAGSAGWGPTSPDPVQRMLVLDIPSAFYGRQVAPGSVRMTCRAFEGLGLVRTLIDDGRGGLFVSGSMSSSSLADREEYRGVEWNKVGNVFYGEGLAVIRDPALLDFGRSDQVPLEPTGTLEVSFRGDSRVPVKTLMCRIDHGEFNCTTNPTFYLTGSAGERLRRHASGSLRVSTVGLYNSHRELVAVARLADPVRIRARDRINIRIRIDF